MPSSDWLMTPRSVRLLPLAGITMVGSLFYMFGLILLSGTKALSQLESSIIFRTFSGVIGVTSAVAGIYLMIGMLWYWGALDSSTRARKILWLVLFLTTGFLGLAAYSFLVYRRQAEHQVRVEGQA